MKSYDVIVVGAGPSGLFAALNSCPKGCKVLVLEKGGSAGKKLLISGSSQCNLTHSGEVGSFLSHYGQHGRFLRPALFSFDNQDLIDFFETRGLAMMEVEGGKVFPQTLRSRDVLDILIEECSSAGVALHYNERVDEVNRRDHGFEVVSENLLNGSKRRYQSRVLVVATGGMSYPSTGSTGDGYRLAREMGHRVTEAAPALTPVYIRDFPFFDLAGISFRAVKISLSRDGERPMSRRGDLLFTHQGLSGPGILDLSRYIRASDLLEISFVDREDEFQSWFRDKLQICGKRALKGVLAEYGLPERFAVRILEVSGVTPGLKCAHLNRGSRNLLEKNLAGFPMVVEDLGGFDVAMVTRGGVDLWEINRKTMESKLVSNLYFVGEVLDVDGDTGGYNLQAAFSTAMLAARAISKRLKSG